MEKLRDDLESAMLKKRSLRRAFLEVKEHANRVLLFGLQWEDLEEHLDYIDGAIGDRLEQLGSQERSVEDRLTEAVLREMEAERKAEELEGEVRAREETLALLERTIEECENETRVKEGRLRECVGEIEAKKNELSCLRGSVDECSTECGVKREELDELRRRIGTSLDEQKLREEKLSLVQKLLGDCTARLDEKTESLRSTEDLLKKLTMELEFKKDDVERIQTELDARCSELDSKNAEVRLLEESLARCSSALDVKNRELISLEDSLKNCCVELYSKKEELHLKDGELASIEALIDEHSEELASNLDSTKIELAMLEEIAKDLEAKNKVKLESFEWSSKGYSDEIESKKKELTSLQRIIEELGGDLESKSMELAAASASLESRNFELDKKKWEIESAESSLVQLESQPKLREGQLQSTQKELDTARTARQECLKEIESAKDSSQERLRAIADKERQLELQFKELKCQQEHLSQMQKALEDRRAQAPTGEGAIISHHQVKVEKLEYPTTPAPCMDDQLNSMLFVCEFFERHDLVHQQLLDKIQMSLDPAKLVLQAMQDFHWISSRQHERRFDSGVINRSCLLLLNYLAAASPKIAPQVKEAAMSLATQWKGQLKTSLSYVHDVLVLLRTIVVYKLTAKFCPKELEELVKSISEHGEANEIRGLLGLTSQLHSSEVRHPHQGVKKLTPSSPRIDDHAQSQHRSKHSRLT